jgi:small subunit ribosomal protein S16
VAVRIRLKRLGRRHRPFFRLCVMDQRTPRDGRVLEEVGTYDPMIPDVDARAVLDGERVNYWLSVGAQPSPKAKVLITKYGADGTHLQQQKESLERLAEPRVIPDPGTPASLPEPPPSQAPPAAEPAADSHASAAAPAATVTAEEPAAATPATDAAPAESEEASPEEDSST